MILSITVDFFKSSKPDFGVFQGAGFSIGAILVLSGIRKATLENARIWNCLFLLFYLAGILYMGLKPTSYNHYRVSGILQNISFSFSDVIINILGFIPFGYLMMSHFFSSSRIKNKITAAIIAMVSCFGISLLIEVAQAYIPYRCSSLIDLFLNGLGAFIGIIYCMIENRLSHGN